jgi:hypothetical protein
MIPVFVAALSLGVEVSGWEATQMSVQRTADVSAMAGLMICKANSNCATAGSAQTAATFAARMAQLNGATGTTSPTWNTTCGASCTSPCTGTLTDNQIIAQIMMCSGTVTNSDVMIKVSVQRPVSAMVSKLFNTTSSYTITGSATSELVSSGGGYSGTGNNASSGGGQPCLLALSTSGTISGQGSTYWTMPGCTVRSNGTVDVHGGGGPLTTGGIYAGGLINIDSWIATTGGQYPNDGVITDPYAGNTGLKTALTNAAALTGVTSVSCGTTGGVLGSAGQYTGNNNCNGTNTLPNGGTCATASGVTCTMNPGNYGSWIVPSGGPYTFNLQPGLYLFNGPVILTQNTTTNGSGVTIIVTGGTYNSTAYSFAGENSFNFNVTAPTPTQVSNTGGVAGIALATTSSTTAVISGNAAFNVTGVAYFPNAIFDASGSSCNSSAPCFGSNSTTCLEIIASSIKLNGNSNFASTCGSLGAATFASLPGSSTSSAQLVH